MRSPNTSITLVGPKIFPPFDSSYSSIGFNILKALIKINSDKYPILLKLVTSYDWSAYRKLYLQSLNDFVKDYNSFASYCMRNKCLLVRCTWSLKDIVNLDFLLAKILKEDAHNNYELVLTLIPLKLSLLYRAFIRRNSKIKIIYYLFHGLRLLERKLSAFYDLVIVSSRTLITLSNSSFRRPKFKVIHPPIDTDFYKPLPQSYVKNVLANVMCYKEIVEAKDQDRLLILYLGPVHPLRFPPSAIIGMVRRLVRRGIDPLLMIVTTIRHVGIDDVYVTLWKHISQRINKHIKIIVRALSEFEKLLLYNISDVVIYPTARPWAMAIPPLTILEAYSCGKPVILTKSVPGYEEVTLEGFEELVVSRPTSEELCMAVGRALASLSKVPLTLRRFCVNRFSLGIFARRFMRILPSVIESS